MTYQFKNPSPAIIKSYLEDAHRIAIVGLSNRTETAAYMVASYLQDHGYDILPVNPKLAGETILGATVYGSLSEVPGQVDIVDVFRRSEFLPAVAEEFLQTDAKIFWAQLGLESQEAEEILRAAGRKDIVMNKCIKIEHRDLLEAH